MRDSALLLCAALGCVLLCACSDREQQDSTSAATTAAVTETAGTAETTAFVTASTAAQTSTSAQTTTVQTEVSAGTGTAFSISMPQQITAFTFRSFPAASTAAVTTAATTAKPAETEYEPVMIWKATDDSGAEKIRVAVTYRSPIRDQLITIYSGCYLYYYEKLCAAPREKEPYTSPAKYEYYLHDMGSREISRSIARSILNGEVYADRTEYEKVCEAIAFVQAIPYVTDQESVGKSEYWRYPLETLFGGCGDCEDSSLLLAGILHEMGFEPCFLYITKGNAGHIALGIRSNDAEHASFAAEGKYYYYIETTDTGWRIGQVPKDVQGNMTAIFPEW